MTWVRFSHEQEAIVEVDLPLAAGEEALREAAFEKIEQGLARWGDITVDTEVSEEEILPFAERMEAQRMARVENRKLFHGLLWRLGDDPGSSPI
jgi:hypothetical protein